MKAEVVEGLKRSGAGAASRALLGGCLSNKIQGSALRKQSRTPAIAHGFLMKRVLWLLQ